MIEPRHIGPLNARDQSAVDAGCVCIRMMPYTDWSHDPRCPLFFDMFAARPLLDKTGAP